jgi:HAD superfamily hydrolase (TIGR01509 family)
MLNTTAHSQAPIAAVLFDLSGTTLDEGYIRHGVAAVADEIARSWDLDPSAVSRNFMPAFRSVTESYGSLPYYRMSDVVCDTLAQIIGEGGSAVRKRRLLELEELMWSAAIEQSTPADGAVETLTRLHHAGIRTGIVSYADIPVFRALLERTGLAGLCDVEICSEQARSCKPHPTIFLRALAEVGTAPRHSMFVGDAVDADIVGGNRVGMRTALVTGREFTLDTKRDDPEAQPTYLITHLTDIVGLVELNPFASPNLGCADGAHGDPNVQLREGGVRTAGGRGGRGTARVR